MFYIKLKLDCDNLFRSSTGIPQKQIVWAKDGADADMFMSRDENETHVRTGAPESPESGIRDRAELDRTEEVLIVPAGILRWILFFDLCFDDHFTFSTATVAVRDLRDGYDDRRDARHAQRSLGDSGMMTTAATRPQN